MSKPLNLSISQQRLLYTLTGSSVGDNFFVKCHQLPMHSFFDALFRSILEWISFYFIGQACVFLLLVLPIIFFFQASGKQKKIQKLYSRTRLMIIKFLYICTFASLASPIIGWAAQQPGPCVIGRASKFAHLGAKYQLPSVNLVLGSIISLFIFKADIKNGLHFSDSKNILTHCSTIFEYLFTKVIAAVVLGFFFCVELFYGKANILQALFSVFFGFLIDVFVDVTPIFVSYIVSLVLFILGIFFMIFNPRPSIVPFVYDEMWDFILYGFGFLFFSDYLIFFFIRTRSDFFWTSYFSDFLTDKEAEIESGVAAFGELDIEGDSENYENSDIKNLLMNDLRDSGIATLMQIAMNVVQQMVMIFANPKDI